MTGRWSFTAGALEATREPPMPDPRQLPPLREMLADIGDDVEILGTFLSEDWPDLLDHAGDPDAEYCGNGITFRVSGDEVVFTPLYDQWDDAGYVYVPLADVQDMLDQFAAYVRER